MLIKLDWFFNVFLLVDKTIGPIAGFEPSTSNFAGLAY